MRELADALGVHRAVVYRLVATLELHGLVRRDDEGRHRLGTGVLELARDSVRPRGDRDATRGQPVFRTVNVNEDLALEDVQSLVLPRVRVQRRRLTLWHEILEQEEGAACLLGTCLDGQESAAQEAKMLSLAVSAYDRDSLAHDRSSPFMEHYVS